MLEIDYSEQNRENIMSTIFLKVYDELEYKEVFESINKVNK